MQTATYRVKGSCEGAVGGRQDAQCCHSTEGMPRREDRESRERAAPLIKGLW